MFLTIYMQQFGWLSERGGNFLNLLQKEEGSLGKGGGGFQPWRKLWLFYGKFGTIKKPFSLCSRFILLSVNDSELEMRTKSLSEFNAKCPGDINCFSIHANLHHENFSKSTTIFIQTFINTLVILRVKKHFWGKLWVFFGENSVCQFYLTTIFHSA